MSNTCCGNCGCDPCLCENPYQPDVDNLKEGTPVIQITGEPESSCIDPDDICPVGPQCEEFTVPSSVTLYDGEDFGDFDIVVEVCDAALYKIGTCVTVRGTVTTSSSTQAVLRVTGFNTWTREVTLRQYYNESDNEGAILSGTMHICPMSHCLEETVPEVEVCHEFKVLTSEQFTVPADDGTATSQLDLAECTDLEQNDRIHIRNDDGSIGCYDIFSVDDDGDLLHVTNPGLSGNAAETTTISAGARVTLIPLCVDVEEAAEAAEESVVWHKSYAPSAYTTGLDEAWHHTGGSPLSQLDSQIASGFYVDVPVLQDEIFLCQGHVTIGSPKCSVQIKADSTGVFVSATRPAYINPTNFSDGVEGKVPDDAFHGQDYIPFPTCAITEILVADADGTMRVTFYYANPYYLNNGSPPTVDYVNAVVMPLWNRSLTITKIANWN
jgi:hypothetical protein